MQYDEGRLPHADGGFQVSDPGSATEREARAAEDSASRLSPKETLREPVLAPPARTTAPGPGVAEIQRSPNDPPQTPAARVAFVREEGLNLRAGPDQKAASSRKMTFGQRVHVLEDADKGEWRKIAVLGQTGYVYKPKIHFPPEDLIEKDPGLTLIKVKPGQNFWGLVKQTYGIQGNESSSDQNIDHFINAIRAVNKPEAFKVKTTSLNRIGNAVVSGRDASDTELTAGVDLWIPSFGVAANMDVGSATVTGEAARSSLLHGRPTATGRRSRRPVRPSLKLWASWSRPSWWWSPRTCSSAARMHSARRSSRRRSARRVWPSGWKSARK